MIQMITSIQNKQVRNVVLLNGKAKARHEQGLFVAEGRKMFLEAPPSWVERTYVSESLALEDASLFGKASSFPYEVVTDTVFSRMSDTQSPQGILTVLRIPSYKPADLAKPGGLYVVLENLQDPGNLGTILRTGEGAGIAGVLLTKGCVDLFSPKVIRSTMGSIYRVPFLLLEDISEAKLLLHDFGAHTYAAHLKGKESYDAFSYQEGTAFFIGNEGNGLTEAAAGVADTLIRIPMAGQVESLNAAMAAGILLYEAARQRRQVSGNSSV